MVRTQSEAKRFFVDKVVARARVERVSLSDAERQMLSWSESDPDFIVDPRLPQQLASEMSDEHSRHARPSGRRTTEALVAVLAVTMPANRRWT
jgi:hypothetical protein